MKRTLVVILILSVRLIVFMLLKDSVHRYIVFGVWCFVFRIWCLVLPNIDINLFAIPKTKHDTLNT